MSTRMSDRQLQVLRETLQRQAERQAEELARLDPHDGPGSNGLDPQAVATLMESTRQLLTDTTDALKRLDDGGYGICQRCQGEIPVERLEILPHARYCVPCQQKVHG